MADGDVFAALLTEVRHGGGNTDEVGRRARRLALAYEEATGYDPGNPPWGQGDEIARTFAEGYVRPHAELRDALTALADAITAAGARTLASGRNFSEAQNAALDGLRPHGDGRR